MLFEDLFEVYFEKEEEEEDDELMKYIHQCVNDEENVFLIRFVEVKVRVEMNMEHLKELIDEKDSIFSKDFLQYHWQDEYR